MDELVLREVTYSYPKTDKRVIESISCSFRKGTFTAICGKSGAGKSTLLYLLAGLEKPTQGTIEWEGNTVENLRLYRKNSASYISQSYLLFPTRTALENVCYPLLLHGKTRKEALIEGREWLIRVGIANELWNRFPNKLSGGEQQRVAIARCLAAHTDIIAADEPTGNLDINNAQQIIRILKDMAHEDGKIVIMITHDKALADQADQVLFMENGNLVYGREQKSYGM